MRFDMHCHTKEGSLDGRVPLQEYVLRLKKLGFDGMLITDHNSYKAYRQYIKHKKDPAFADFTVLKGIEYDTCDAGHILVVMPENFSLPLLELRGLPVRLLIEIVHMFHGILGPAHPTGEKYMSITKCKVYRKHPDILSEFDFMEVHNACVTPQANQEALRLAEQYKLPGTSGSDAHKLDCIGFARTDFKEDIHSESDLIAYIKKAAPITCGGSHYSGSTRDHLGIVYDFLLWVFSWYSKWGNRNRRSKREAEVKDLLTTSTHLIERLHSLHVAGWMPEQTRLQRILNELLKDFPLEDAESEDAESENAESEDVTSEDVASDEPKE